MSETVNTATIRVVADASGVEAGLRQATNAARQTGRAVSEVGAGAATSARQVEAAQRNIVQAIQRTTVAMEAGGKSTAAYYELLARQRGIDPSVLTPYLNQLRAVEEAQTRAAHTATAHAAAQQAAQQQAAESARAQAAAQRELAQAQASRDNFVAGLREQVALFGASTEEVLRYRAAQLGAAQAAEPLITQLQALRVAQEQAAAAARVMERAQHDATQIDSSRDGFLSGLREEIALFGRSIEEVQLYRAAQLNAANAAAPLIAQLRALREAQEQAAAAARAMEQAQREALQINASRDSFLSGLREQIALFGRSAEEVQRYRAAELGAANAAAPLIAQLKALRDAQEQANQAQRDQAGRDSFIKGLEQQAQAIGKTRIELLELQAAQLGVTAQARPYIDQLRAASEGHNNGAMSAAAMAAALRQVPAQLTDIIVGLQGGQAPLTVILQQGGQLRDMFGSVGGAAKALGGAILNLINPYTVTIAAVGALAYAYKLGHEESIEYARGLAATGNFAGVTTGQLGDMARQIGEVTGSQHAAAGALAELVRTGAIAGSNLTRFGIEAIEAQYVLKKSVEDTAAEFAQLGKSPLSALQSIGEKYHIITAATYEQVKAAQEHGRTLEAANIAQQAYADEIGKQRQKVLDSLSDWERGWLRIKRAASGAVDAVIDFAGGREKSNFEKINDLLSEREKIQANLNRAKDRGLDADVKAFQAELDANQREINAIRDKDAAKKKTAETEAAGVRADELRKKWIDEQNTLLTRQQLLERDLAAARTEGQANGLSEEEIQNRLLVIRRKYNDVYIQGIDTNITALRRQAELEGILDQRTLARIETQRALGGISEGDAINQVAKIELDALDRQKTSLQEQLALIRTKINSQREQKDLEGQIAVVGEQRRSREKQQENDLLLLQERRRQASEALYIKGVTDATAERDSLIAQLEAQFQYNQEIGLSTTQLAELRAARMNNAAALKEETAAMLDFKEPGNQVSQIYREQAQALRDLGEAQVRGAYKDQMVTQWKQAVDQYGQVFQQGFADMLNNGMDGWKSFTKSLVTTFKTSVADQIYKMFARPIIVQLVGSYLGISQTAIAGEIASQPNAYGVTASSAGGVNSAVSAAQMASTVYKAISGGFDGLGTSVADAVQAALYKSGLSSNIASNGAAATAAGTAAAYGAGLIGGHYIGNAIAGDYSVNHGQAVTNIASVIGAIVGGPIGGVIGGAIGGLFNRAFGMGSKEVTGQGISGTLSASSLTGQNYTTWHQNGGWFRSDKNGTDTTALTDAMVKQFTQGLAAIESASSNFASSLGVQADWIKDYSKVFDLKLTGDATKDQQVITDFFQGIGDEIAKKLVPNLDDLSKSGETASAALERLANDFKGTDQIAQLLGFSASSLFGSVGLDSAKAREQLIDMAGGLQVLSGYASTFNREFLTDAERIAPVAEALDKALASLGLSTIPTTRDEFKSLVNDLITSGAAVTESGAKQLDSLLALAEAFAMVHPAADAAAEAVDRAAEAMKAVKDAASTMLAGVNDAFGVLQKVVGREKSLIQASVDTHTAAFNKLQSLSQALHSTLDSMRSPDQKAFERAAAQAQIRAALAIAKAGGPLPDSDSLKAALSAVTQDASSQFSSYADYMRDLLQTQNDVAQLAGLTDDSLSVEQRSLDALKDQLTRLDDIVANGQAQLDALNGQSIATLSLAQALAAFQSSIASAQTNPVVSGTSSIASMYLELLGRAPDQAGLQYWQDALARGNQLDAIRSGIMESDEYKRLHPFAIGTNYVPETMPALVHQGERIIPAADNRALMARLASPSGNNEALVAEIKALRDEVKQLREANSAENRAIAKGAQQTAEHLDAAINGDTPLATKVIA